MESDVITHVRLYLGCELQYGKILLMNKKSPLILQPNKEPKQKHFEFRAKDDCLTEPLVLSGDLESITSELSITQQRNLKFEVKSILSYQDNLDKQKLAALTKIRAHILGNGIPAYDTFQGGNCHFEVFESGARLDNGRMIRINNGDFCKGIAPYFVR